MYSFVVTVVVLFGLCSDALAVHKTRGKRGEPYAELISDIKHYLARRQNSPPSSTYKPGPEGGSGFTPSPSPTLAPSTDSSAGPKPSPTPWPTGNNSSPWIPGSNSSNSLFNLDSNLHCPILTQILWRRVLNFPRTDDMVDFITFRPEMFRPLVKHAMRLLTFVDDPEVAALFLVRRFTQEVVERRLTCATAKYQQVIFYAITQEMKSTFRNDSLSSKLTAVLQGFPRSMNLSHRIMFSLHGHLFYSLMDFALKEEFGELDNFVERFYHYTEHRFREMKNTAITSPDMWTQNFQQEMGNQFMQNGRALQCTSMDEMKRNHRRIANETREGFLDMMETGYVHRIAYKMLSEVASEFYKNEWSTTYEKIFPFGQITQILLDYTKDAMKVIKNYEYNLFNSPLNSLETIFAKYLGPGQRQIFQNIIAHLTNLPPSPSPPYPTGSPVPDWNYIRNEVQESQSDLKNLLTMLNTPSLNRDEITRVVTKVMVNLDQLIQAGTKIRPV